MASLEANSTSLVGETDRLTVSRCAHPGRGQELLRDAEEAWKEEANPKSSM